MTAGVEEHRERVPIGGGWTLWPWAVVRGAGFDVREVLDLVEPATARAVDRLLELDRVADSRRTDAIAELEPIIESHTGRARKPIGKALRALRRGRDPNDQWLDGLDLPALAAFRAARRQHADAADTVAEVAASERARIQRAIGAWARDDRLREAVAWQNRAVVPMLDHVADDAVQTSSKARNRQLMTASYLQRYCTKNDTIGFFGPIGWGAITGTPGVHVEATAGESLLARRAVYFEHWGIDAVAAALARTPAVLERVAPRLAPTLYLDGEVLRLPIGRQRPLSPVLLALLSACDGITPAAEVAAAVSSELGVGPDEILEMIGELADQGVLIWTLEVPTATFEPERYLRRALEQIGEPAAPGLALLSDLEADRASVAASAGDSNALSAALDQIAGRFEAATGVSANRGAGETYAGRTLVYEECVRDLSLTVGGAAVERFSAPIELVLQSARWFTYEIASRYRAAFDDRFESLERDGDGVDYLVFWEAVSELFSAEGEPSPIVDEVAAELREGWSEVLGLPSDSPQLELRSQDIAPRVRELFSAPGPGWPAARHHSPDLMIAAASAAAAACGEYRAVIGEVHVALNTVTLPFIAREHDHPDALARARVADLPGVHIAPVKSKQKTRADFFSISPADLDLELSDARSPRPRDQVVAVGSLAVDRRDGSLVVRQRGGSLVIDIIAFFEHYLIAECHSKFEMVKSPSPRVTVDDLVIARRSWHADPASIGLANTDRLERYVAVRRWAAELGLLRHVFVKSDAETKPIYLDLDSPLLVKLFARIAGMSSALSISEMLPAIDECWLPGPADQTYTCELRIAAVDPNPWRPPNGV